MLPSRREPKRLGLAVPLSGPKHTGTTCVSGRWREGISYPFVDDYESIRELLRMHLSAAGYEVRTAEDGIDAGYAVLREAPELIVCDVNMPHMDRFEFVAGLKVDKSLPPIPVIFLSSAEDADYRGKQLGAVGYLTKPVRADHLLSLIAWRSSYAG
jgi:two-component system, chemotaxis family, sensor histidine kinase and response regulator PixL